MSNKWTVQLRQVIEDVHVPKPAEKAVTLTEYRVVRSRWKKDLAKNIFIVALMATAVWKFGRRMRH